MDKTQSKLIALSVLGLARSLLGSSKKAAFVIDLLTNMVMESWDSAWDTFTAKNKPLMLGAAKKGSSPDPFDALAECAGQ
jgi:hypothetical protein